MLSSDAVMQQLLGVSSESPVACPGERRSTIHTELQQEPGENSRPLLKQCQEETGIKVHPLPLGSFSPARNRQKSSKIFKHIEENQYPPKGAVYINLGFLV